VIEPKERLSNKGTIASYVQGAPRLVRFVSVGGVASLLQLFLLYVIQLTGISKLLANFFAFEISTQVNFTLSYFITWYDRTPKKPTVRYVVERLMAFNGMAVTTLIINMSVFAVMLFFVHYLVAGALGIIAATTTNFVVSSRLIFRLRNGVSRGPVRSTLGRWPF
jgi:dolichol-phosphate mannosyltransferase